MKKLIALAVTLALSLCLFACGGDKKKDDPNSDITKNPDGSIDLPMIDVDFN